MSETPENKSELDEYGVWIKSPAPAEKNDDTQAQKPVELPDDFSLDNIEIPEIPLEQSIGEDLEKSVDVEPEEIPAVEDVELPNNEEAAIADEISKLNSFDDFETSLPEEPKPAETEEVPATEEIQAEPKAEEAEKVPEPAAEIPDGEIDLDSFLDSSSDSPSQDGEVDLSAFMGGDSGNSPDFGDGDIDLDAFMDGASFEGEKEEQAEIEEADPLDIDLDFEEPVLEGSDSESQENEAEDNSEDFDSLFENLSDETPELPDLPEIEQDASPSPAAVSTTDSEEIDLSDFGFEDNSENLNPVLGDEKEKKEPAGPVDYEMNVDIEDDNEPQPEKTEKTSTSESSDDDDIQVDISQDSEKAVQKEQETDLSSPDDSFDIDSIFNNIEDENGQTVDFSASETPKEEAKEPAKAEEIPAETIADDFPAAETFQEPEPEIAQPEEVLEETQEENVSTESSDTEISLDDFMGEEGFTDGGPGVTGPYNEDGTLIQREEKKEPAAEEPETVEEPETLEEPEVAEEPEIADETSVEDFPEPDIFEAPEIADSDEEVPQQEAEKDDLDVSSYLDEAPDYDMTGVTVTPEDLENISEVPAEPAVPDTFEEEAASLSDEVSIENPENEEEKQTYSVFAYKDNSNTDIIEETAQAVPEIQQNENEQPLEENMQTEDFQNEEKIDNSAILNKIAEELASLKSEINGLKDEFEELKKNGVSSEKTAEIQDIEETEIPAEEQPAEEMPEAEEPSTAEKEDTGFFNNTDEDDTIALSGDELSNILNSAEFTSHDAEAIDTETEETNEPEPAEKIEEPVESEETEISELQPEEEITVPAATENFEEPEISEPKEIAEPEIDTSSEVSEPEIAEQPEEPAQQEDEKATITDEDIPSPTLESLNIQNTEIKDEPLTEDNIEYLTSEVPEELREEENEAEDENLETGISEHPVENVFTNWEAAPEPEKTEIQNLEEPASESPAEIKDRSNEIPADMKAEIKSVLAYMDQLLENLPEDKIAEFAQSEQFETYKKLFAELGLS